jgi:hypothetical protein
MNSIRAIRQHLEMFQQTFSNSLTELSPHNNQPPHITTPLRIHQLTALHEMFAKEVSFQTGYPVPNSQETLFSKYAILGDNVGVGKTLTVLGHISQMATYPLSRAASHPLSNLSPTSTSACFSIRPNAPTENLFDSLVVVPHTIYRQWQESIETHTTLKVHYLKTQRDLDKDTIITNIRGSHLTLISNNLLGPFLSSLKARQIVDPTWRRVFYDEADSIKITSSFEPPQANMTWFVTATFANLLFSNTYYHSFIIRQLQQEFIDVLAPELQDMLNATITNHPTVSFFKTNSFPFFQSFLKSQHPLRGHLVVRSTNTFINQSVQLPPLHQQTIRCQTPLSHHVLESAIPAETEAMLHAGDIQAALQSLGIPQHTPLTIVEAVSEFRKKELDRLKRLLAFKQEETYANPQMKEQAIKNLTEKITRLEAQIHGIIQRLEQASKEVCAICFDTPTNAVLTPCCSKLFCANCILQWMLRTPACALCRANIHPNELKSIGDTQSSPAEKPVLPKKVEALLDIFRSDPDGRFLVFSRFDNPLINIQETITESYPSQTLQGNKDSIAKQIADFESGRVKILLLNSRSASAGLNLPSATHVILLHKMGNDEEKQILGRAYRLGRSKPLHFIKLLHQKE